jgi:hypothetical protein
MCWRIQLILILSPAGFCEPPIILNEDMETLVSNKRVKNARRRR